MNYRHGDLALIGIDKLPDGLKKSDSKVLMTGSGGNDHTYDVGEFYPKQGGTFNIGYFVSTDETKLYHKEHGSCRKSKELRELSIRRGVYLLKKQNEDTHSGMKPVVD